MSDIILMAISNSVKSWIWKESNSFCSDNEHIKFDNEPCCGK